MNFDLSDLADMWRDRVSPGLGISRTLTKVPVYKLDIVSGSGTSRWLYSAVGQVGDAQDPRPFYSWWCDPKALNRLLGIP